MKTSRIVPLLVLVVLLASACRGSVKDAATDDTGKPPEQPSGEITVFAASSLTDAFNEIGEAFERVHPGTSVRFNFGGSGALRQQLEQGAPGDVFASADARQMEAAVNAGLVAGTPAAFARNRLVVIAPRDNPGRIGGVETLDRPGLKLVLAGPGVPAGAYARAVLERLGKETSSRILANVRSEESNVRAVVTKVQLGEADAGIVYASDVTPAVAPRLHVFAIPDALNVIADYPITALARARNARTAAAFVDFVRGQPGQAILARHGFIIDATTSARPPGTAP